MHERARDIRVVCFDVDGTLVQHPGHKTVWQVLNEKYLDGDAINGERFARFKAGTLSYPEWVRLDVMDWIARDVRREHIVAAIRAELRATDGARETIEALKARGYGVAVISGTIDATIGELLDGVVFDRCFTNRLHYHDDGRIRAWEATPYDVAGKPKALDRIAAELGVTSSACAFVGDAWNDLAVLRHAGFGIAFHPKSDDVREAADLVIESGPMTALLDVFTKEIR